MGDIRLGQNSPAAPSQGWLAPLGTLIPLNLLDTLMLLSLALDFQGPESLHILRS